jgi:hypothetical protein
MGFLAIDAIVGYRPSMDGYRPQARNTARIDHKSVLMGLSHRTLANLHTPELRFHAVLPRIALDG